MSSSLPANLTLLLGKSRQGDQEAHGQLFDAVYHELRQMASRYMRSERDDHTLQPTALVNEAYLRLIDQKNVDWQSRAHFFAIAAQTMRRILVDHARSRLAEKRGGEHVHVTLTAAMSVAQGEAPDLIALDEALGRLTQMSERQGRVVELRYFGGLSIEETASALDVSPATVKRDWDFAKAWLYRELSNDDAAGAKR